jgi:hypothetical protein
VSLTIAALHGQPNIIDENNKANFKVVHPPLCCKYIIGDKVSPNTAVIY